MSLEEMIFKRQVFDLNKVLAYGFEEQEGCYHYRCKILDQFQLLLTIDHEQKLHGKMYDIAFHEEYINFRRSSQNGEFVTAVRQQFIAVLQDIKEHCCSPQLFLSAQANRLADQLAKTQHIQPKFPWKKDPYSAVFTHQKNQKWFALIMGIEGRRLGLKHTEVEIINLKLPQEKIIDLLSEPSFFPAYHMNKKHWISILLDADCNDALLYSLVKTSYLLTCQTGNSR